MVQPAPFNGTICDFSENETVVVIWFPFGVKIFNDAHKMTQNGPNETVHVIKLMGVWDIAYHCLQNPLRGVTFPLFNKSVTHLIPPGGEQNSMFFGQNS